MLTHMGRELIQGVLQLILGGSFADAHKNSRHVKCGDGVFRRWLLDLLLHSADYKEKCVSQPSKKNIDLTGTQIWFSDNKEHGVIPLSSVPDRSQSSS